MTTRATGLTAPLASGAVLAIALGLYGSLHEPTGRDFVLYGFESAAGWKSALSSIVVLMFIVQLTMGCG